MTSSHATTTSATTAETPSTRTGSGAVRDRLTVCLEFGCPTLTRRTRCSEHSREREQQRGSASSRGYGTEHKKLRAEWAPKVEAGTVACARCGLLIQPGAAWHLDHTDDRAGYLGPSCAYCNLAAAGRATAGR